MLEADGKTLYSGSWDKTIIVWATATSTQTAQLEGHTEWVHCLALTADGQTVKLNVLEVESNGGAKHDTGSSGAARGFLPLKTMVPKVFGKTDSEWRRWQDDMIEYFDLVQPGMKALLKVLEKGSDEPDDNWAASMLAKGHS